MCHRDEAGRYQMTRCYTGTFDGGRFKTEYQQWYDFGSNFYAVQSFEHSGRRIAIGWISDFTVNTALSREEPAAVFPFQGNCTWSMAGCSRNR